MKISTVVVLVLAHTLLTANGNVHVSEDLQEDTLGVSEETESLQEVLESDVSLTGTDQAAQAETDFEEEEADDADAPAAEEEDQLSRRTVVIPPWVHPDYKFVTDEPCQWSTRVCAWLVGNRTDDLPGRRWVRSLIDRLNEKNIELSHPRNRTRGPQRGNFNRFDGSRGRRIGMNRDSKRLRSRIAKANRKMHWIQRQLETVDGTNRTRNEMILRRLSNLFGIRRGWIDLFDSSYNMSIKTKGILRGREPTVSGRMRQHTEGVESDAPALGVDPERSTGDGFSWRLPIRHRKPWEMASDSMTPATRESKGNHDRVPRRRRNSTIPIMASLEKNGTRVCSAVMVHRRWALTSARCLEDVNHLDTFHIVSRGSRQRIDDVIPVGSNQKQLLLLRVSGHARTGRYTAAEPVANVAYSAL